MKFRHIYYLLPFFCLLFVLPIGVKATTGILKDQLVVGQYDYLGTNYPAINSYQPFDTPLSSSEWQNITELDLSLMTALGGDSNLWIGLRYAQTPADCDTTFIDQYFNTVTVTADGIYNLYKINPHENLMAGMCGDYPTCPNAGDTIYNTVCGIVFAANGEQGVIWTRLGDTGDYPKFQLDINSERVSDYSLYFKLYGNTPTCTGTACDSWVLPFNYLCAFADYLFNPSSVGTSAIANAKDNIEAKFPYTLYTDISTTVFDNASSTATTTTFNLIMPDGSGKNLGHLWDSAELKTKLSAMGYDPIYNTLIYIIYFVLFIYFFIRFRQVAKK